MCRFNANAKAIEEQSQNDAACANDAERSPTVDGSALDDQHIFNDAALDALSLELADVKVEMAETSDPRVTDLTHFHSLAVFEELCRSNFTFVKKIADGINGQIFKYRWRHDEKDQQVAVKQLRNATLQQRPDMEANDSKIHMSSKPWNARSTEDALTEIGVLSHLSKQEDLPSYVLKMHGVFSDSASNLTWLVSEFADGGELFDVACSGATSEAQLRTYTGQMLEAVEYLHRHNIGHRDISLENILLKDGICKLMDFGMAVSSRSASGTPLRYFRTVGKQFYRGPECYVPEQAAVTIRAPSDASPGDIVLVETSGFLCEVRLPKDVDCAKSCRADVWGYAAEPADTFALGVCMFIIAFQCPPWELAALSNHYFQYVYRQEKGLQSMLKQWNKPLLCPEAMSLLTSLLQIEPTKRLSAADYLQNAWLADKQDGMEKVHEA